MSFMPPFASRLVLRMEIIRGLAKTEEEEEGEEELGTLPSKRPTLHLLTREPERGLEPGGRTAGRFELSDPFTPSLFWFHHRRPNFVCRHNQVVKLSSWVSKSI